MTAIDDIRAAFAKRGERGVMARASPSSSMRCNARSSPRGMARQKSLVVATLLHDIGHMLHDLPEDIADQGCRHRA